MIRTKNDIIRQLGKDYDMDPARARRVIHSVLSGIVNATLEHGKIEIRRFGTFKICQRASRVARNPRTNEPLRLPARHVLTFEPSRKVSQLVLQQYKSSKQQQGRQRYPLFDSGHSTQSQLKATGSERQG